MSIFDKTKQEISGPVNIIRMEGKVGNINKVIYLFMDIHNPLSIQTECDNVYSQDLNKYFAESFYELNDSSIKYDFFFEVKPSELAINIGSSTRRKKNIYINQVYKLFTSAFNYDADKDTVRLSRYFSNVRLHYLDVRDYLKKYLDSYFNDMLDHSYEFLSSAGDSDNLSLIIKIATLIKERIDIFVSIFRSSKPVKPSSTPTIKGYNQINQASIERIVYKIRHRYNHSDIKNILVKFFDDNVNDLAKLSTSLQTTIQKIRGYAKYIKDNTGVLHKTPNGMYGYAVESNEMFKIGADIYDLLSNIHASTVDIFAKLTDVYLLRRFLDKDYVTNAIVYTGIAHSEIYVAMLASKFGFVITHASYMPVKNISLLNSKIKQAVKNNIDITQYITPRTMHQCSDITDFPKRFL